MAETILALVMICMHLIGANSQVEVIKHPENSTARHMQGEAILRCEFNTEVECVWKRNGHGVAFSHRYFLLSKRNRTRDCSLVIANPDKDVDEGYWTCSIPVDSSTSNGAESHKAFLNIIRQPASPDTHVTGDQSSKVDTLIISVSAIAGIVVIVIVIIGIFTCCYFCKKRQKISKNGANDSQSSQHLRPLPFAQTVFQPCRYPHVTAQILHDAPNGKDMEMMQYQPHHCEDSGGYLAPLVPVGIKQPRILTQTDTASCSAEEKDRGKNEKRYINLVNEEPYHIYDQIDLELLGDQQLPG